MKDNRQDTGLNWTAEEIASRTGVNTDTFYSDKPFGSAEIEMVHQAGLHLLEMSGFFPSMFNHKNQEQQDEIISACRKNNVRIVSFHSPILPYSSENEDERKEAVEEGVANAKVSCMLGAEIFVGHFGLGIQSKRSVLEMAERLEGLPIRLAVENEDDVDVRDVLNFVDEIDSPLVGMVVDIGHPRDADGINPFLKEDIAFKTLEQCGSRVIHVHLHETHIIDHVPPFTGIGNIRWGEVFSALKAINYPGYFIFEYGCKKKNAVLPGSEEEKLQAVISNTPVEIVESALNGTPEQLAANRDESESVHTPEKQLRDYVKTILRMDIKTLGRHPRGIVRNVLGATTEELLKATANFPEEFVRRYCR